MCHRLESIMCMQAYALQLWYYVVQAKYYERTKGAKNSERRDTDRMLVLSSDSKPVDYILDLHVTDLLIINVILFSTTNLVIAIMGIYYVPKILRQIMSYSERNNNNLFMKKELKELFWATVIVSAVVNIACSAFPYTYYHADNMPILPIYLLFFVLEVISSWLSVNDLKIIDNFCGCSNRYWLRAIHTLAVCHILWFLHRVGCNLLIATFFIALAPTQTVAAICLIYFVIFSSILYLTVTFHYFGKIQGTCKSCCSVFCKICVLFVLYMLITGFITFLTLFFNELAQHGLTSSGLGSVILSLVAPTIVFIITLRLKKHVEKYFSTANPDSSEVLRNAGRNHEHVTVDIEQPAVNTPLLANEKQLMCTVGVLVAFLFSNLCIICMHVRRSMMIF